MSVNSKMTAIADKIRSLLNLSGTMGLDGMATNLGTANDHVANALAALTEKEVDATGKGLADLAELIAAIEAGGGGSVTTGTVTFANSTDYAYTGAILEGKDVMPVFVALIALGTTRGTDAPSNAIEMWITEYDSGIPLSFGTNSSIPVKPKRATRIYIKNNTFFGDKAATQFNYSKNLGFPLDFFGDGYRPYAGIEYLWITVSE